MWSEPVPKLSSPLISRRQERLRSDRNDTRRSPDGEFARVHQITEKLPAGWCFKRYHAEFRSNSVQGCTCRHAASNTFQARLLEIRDSISVGSNNCTFRSVPRFHPRKSRRDPLATESHGFTNHLYPMIMLRSPSPSEAAPNERASLSTCSTNSCAYCRIELINTRYSQKRRKGLTVRLGSGWPPPKSGRGTLRTTDVAGNPRTSTRMRVTYGPVTSRGDGCVRLAAIQ